MKKGIKSRLLAMLLTFIMVFGAAPVSVFAEDGVAYSNSGGYSTDGNSETDYAIEDDSYIESDRETDDQKLPESGQGEDKPVGLEPQIPSQAPPLAPEIPIGAPELAIQVNRGALIALITEAQVCILS